MSASSPPPPVACSLLLAVDLPSQLPAGFEPEQRPDGRSGDLHGIDPRAHAVLWPRAEHPEYQRFSAKPCIPVRLAASARPTNKDGAAQDTISATLDLATLWSWPGRPHGKRLAIVALHFSVELGGYRIGSPTLKALEPRFPGGSLTPASPTGDGDFVDLDTFIETLGFARHGRRSLALWVAPWSALGDDDHALAEQRAEACGASAGSAHCLATDDRILFLVRDADTPASALRRMRLPEPDEARDAWSGRGRSFATTMRQHWIGPAAIALGQRVGLEAYGEAFAEARTRQLPGHFREQFPGWLQFRHQFPDEPWFDSQHATFVEEHTRKHLRLAHLARTTHDSYSEAKGYEQEQAAEALTRAVTVLTVIATFLGVLGIGVTAADGMRGNAMSAAASYLIATFAAIVITAAIAAALPGVRERAV